MSDIPIQSILDSEQTDSNTVTKVYLASDHAGFALKSVLIRYLQGKLGFEVHDEGPWNSERVDYPDYAWPLTLKVAQARKSDPNSFGILICGTGIGVSLVANQHAEIRAALAHNIFTAQMARQHNDAQIICLGARVIGQDLALAMIDRFLSTDFEGGRHASRLQLMSKYREQYE